MATKDWKKTFKFQGRYNQSGGKQYIQTYENKEIREVLEIGYDYPKSEKEYFFVRVRNHDWEQGKWNQLTFDTKSEALSFAKKYMRTH